MTRVVLATLAAALLLVAVPQVESVGAASGDLGLLMTTAPHRDCPDTRCSAARSIPAWTGVPVWCWRDAGTLNGTNRWFRVRFNGVDDWVSASQLKVQPSVPYCSDMKPGEKLFGGQSIWSPNGKYRLDMQATDGNLVLHGPTGAIWASRTGGSPGARLEMQTDGNVVVYSSASKPLWWTGTMEVGSYLAVQHDSNVVLYAGSTALYATNWHTTLGRVGAVTYQQGWCTYYAYQRLRDYMGISPYITGDAHKWNENAQANGWLVRTVPSAHSVVVFEATATSEDGHVAWVDGVDLRSDGTWIHVMEMNYSAFNYVNPAGRWVKHGSTPMSYIMARSR